MREIISDMWSQRKERRNVRNVLVGLFLVLVLNACSVFQGASFRFDPDYNQNDLQMYAFPLHGAHENLVGVGVEVSHVFKIKTNEGKPTERTWATFLDPCLMGTNPTSGEAKYSAFVGICNNFFGLRNAIGYDSARGGFDAAVGISAFTGVIDSLTNPSPKPTQ